MRGGSPIPHLQVTVCLELSLRPQTLSKGSPPPHPPGAWSPANPNPHRPGQPLSGTLHHPGSCWPSPSMLLGTLHPAPPALLGRTIHPPLIPPDRDPCGQLGRPDLCPASARRRLPDFLIVQCPMHFPSFLEAPPHALLVPGDPGAHGRSVPGPPLRWPFTHLIHQGRGRGRARRNSPTSEIWGSDAPLPGGTLLSLPRPPSLNFSSSSSPATFLSCPPSSPSWLHPCPSLAPTQPPSTSSSWGRGGPDSLLALLPRDGDPSGPHIWLHAPPAPAPSIPPYLAATGGP